ncbi:hydantoinase/oxoprolinase family protein [Kineobactrum salinum]|uniref:Hydantoinase/oxoprolinase family protein n=1 Tax=Kineobactrum salinum TaxID=2708301 RepID=A0A6C0U2R3_9GAMM|nr:hydantoinase/oxoprolinase family protein [Kineobactrum salinum]QIB66113.1 hydantoinase/oxoprolinase family protein [Kineobactrum salinum]
MKSNPEQVPHLRVAIDVGGTFIDYVVLDEKSGDIRVDKQPVASAELTTAVLEGLERTVSDVGTIDQLLHGMTVSLNALVEGQGVPVGLLTTRGFRDVLEIGRGGRKQVYNLFYREPPPLVERHLRREVDERIDAQGNILLPIDLDALDSELDYLIAAGVQAIAICFLHAYRNPLHEQQARAHINGKYPQLATSASHEIASEWREYERTSTTVLNCHIQPPVNDYLTTLVNELAHQGYQKPVAVMQSSGGVCSPEVASSKPVYTLMSGPSGGVVGARKLCGELGFSNVICADVGGTTFDVALIEQGEVVEVTSTEVAQRPILAASIDIKSIGAGGGSIARIDHRGSIVVGPQSTGARPGPACFGFGGTEPTVTDCQLVLGYFDANKLLGAQISLDVERAREAIRTKLAQPLDLPVEQVAAGVLAIVEANMSNAIRYMTVERGLDPRDFVLMAYGGGGGLFALRMAEELDIRTVIVPRFASNFSAWGLMMSDYMEDASQTFVREFVEAEFPAIQASLRELAQRTTPIIAAYGFSLESIDHLYRIDMRYAGQDYTIGVQLQEAWLENEAQFMQNIRQRFTEAHQRQYGHGDADAPMELVVTRCRAIGRISKPAPAAWTGGTPEFEQRGLRKVFFTGRNTFLDAAIYERDDIAAGAGLDGPAVIEEWSTSVLVPPGWHAMTDTAGNILVQKIDV